MSAPRFLPLLCPACGGDLAGRATDRVAFCPPCGIAVRCDLPALVPLPVTAVAAEPGRAAPDLSLPFWERGGTAVPAFFGARPLSLARVATQLLRRWPLEPRLAEPVPLGARIDAAALPVLARLAGLPAPPADRPLSLVAVPAWREGRRLVIPGFEGTLYPDDVLETAVLVESAGAPV